MKRRIESAQAKVKAIAAPSDAVNAAEWVFRFAVLAVIWVASVAAVQLLMR